MTDGERVLVLTDQVAVILEEHHTEIPDTWCVTFCDLCREAWTVDAADTTPQLSAHDAAVLLLDLLREHGCPS